MHKTDDVVVVITQTTRTSTEGEVESLLQYYEIKSEEIDAFCSTASKLSSCRKFYDHYNSFSPWPRFRIPDMNFTQFEKSSKLR